MIIVDGSQIASLVHRQKITCVVLNFVRFQRGSFYRPHTFDLRVSKLSCTNLSTSALLYAT
jgi:hypothetical protein